MLNGISKVSDYELNTAGVFLDLGHQRNLSKTVSWRTTLNMGYLFPVKYQIIGNVVDSMGQASTLRQNSYYHIGLVTMPVAYYRDRHFSLFVGIGGGLGVQFEQSRSFRTDIAGNIKSEINRFGYTYLTLGWKPIIGASFDLGVRDSGNELELGLSYEDWWTVSEGSSAYPFQWFGLLLAYRHNFRQ